MGDDFAFETIVLGLRNPYEVGKYVGKADRVDNWMLEWEYGFFANVLVDVIISKLVLNKINVKKEGGTVFN